MTERTARWLGSAALALFVGGGIALSNRPLLVSVPLGVVACAVMAFAGRGSALRVGAAATVAAAGVVVICSAQSGNVGWFAMCVLAAWTATVGGRTAGLAFLALSGAVFLAEWFAHPDQWAAWIAGTAFSTIFCLMGRRQRELIEELRAAQAGLADRTRVDERARIARELHDVIAHSLTVSLLHVTSARLAVEEDPAEALAALAEAERLGRQSLTEARQAVGLLRSDGHSAAPLPGADGIAALIDGFRRAGATVDVQVSGELDRLGAAAGLTAYRILQEALTNAARHAAGAPVRVRLDVTAGDLDLTVDSSGTPGPPAADGAGVTGMHERAAALGGRVDAGPYASGWRVHAMIPVAARAAEPA